MLVCNTDVSGWAVNDQSSFLRG